MFDDIDIAIEYCQTKFQILKLIAHIDWQFINIDIAYWILTDSYTILILNVEYIEWQFINIDIEYWYWM